MNLSGNNFLTIRNNHILPKINYGVGRSKYEYWSLKKILTTKLISLKKLTGKSYEIELEKSDYYKAIHCDIELFMNKIYIQYCDFTLQKNISTTWSFITFYYFAFFNSTCLFRFLDKGFIYFSSENSTDLENFYTAVYSDSIKVDTGNYYFALKEINRNGNLIISISHKGESVHKSTWIQLESTLKEFLSNSDQEEAIMYNLLLSQFIDLKSEYPSNIRNKLNYNGESSILDIENSISLFNLVDISSFTINEILSLKNNSNKTEKSIESTNYLTSCIFNLNMNLYSEYKNRSEFGRDFEKERINYLKQKKIGIN